MVYKSLSFLLTVMIFLNSGSDVNWQGTGNMTQDNMTVIRSYINANFSQDWKYSVLRGSTDTKIVDFATTLSNQLNSLWNPAWNVVVVIIGDTANYDSVVYGYAFKGHWMWYCGYKMNDSHYVSFIIWKDYNCIKWQTINRNTGSGYYPSSYANSSPIQNAIGAIQPNLAKAEVWLAAKAYADKLNSDSGVKTAYGSNLAFTIIISQSYWARFYGRVCAKDYMGNYNQAGSRGGIWGTGLILQMR